ncbi:MULTISPECIES: diacylglycerol kinase family protein [Streptomyces]|uniref:NAD(+)/NADH kinase n=1 Tax=Streptomyces koelreuteriae TaxID=2838015 RepID=A0ABX8G3R7_9ACTN|nr:MULTISPECIES: diacylglycerol kinase family protein [Streptomyces]QWB28004.1 NAD(+)/NADH kinase [Streptomyces koelreuteriae]UUA11114.1 NAD(+)/NADH kinase [Streptomyces koelreuteriae]UUA18719.1 NAD(+)/NADH kinase [Streptomyces sp. CRCS-T-1]
MGSAMGERDHRRQRWAARGALAAVALAALLPLVSGGLKGLLLLLAGIAGLALTAAALWWVLSRRGPARMAAAVLALVAPVGVIVLFAAANLIWVVFASLLLWCVAVWSGRYALRSTGLRPVRAKEYRTPPPRRPFLLLNPRSGGGKVEKFSLKEKAEELGARVVLLDPEHHQDVTELAKAAVADGADLLGVAGGDGTQAMVAAVAAEHGLPFLVISAGTRNHFAMDLGLDRDDPSTCLDALTDGVELRVDLGFADDRPFVNNASFGVYGAVVQSPGYRDDKVGAALERLPELLTRQSGPRLTATADGTTIADPQAVLVSNNAYRMDDPFGFGRRERLNSGKLGVLAVRVDSAVEAAELLLSPRPEGLTVLTAQHVVVHSDEPHLEVGLDGEALTLPAPVHCRIARRALRVRVPRNRPGVPEAPPRLDWRRLRKLAAAVGRTAAPTRSRRS